MTVWLLVSATAEESKRLESAGPRRDFLSLARELDGQLVFRGGSAPRGWRGRLLGPHLRQAWRAAAQLRPGDRVFADGEHVGIPLLLAAALRARHPAVVMLGHMPGRWWKRALLALTTRLGTAGTLLVHSQRQLELVRPWLGARWRIEFIPYQVDTRFWTDHPSMARGTQDAPDAQRPPLVLAVGSEQRDYETLIEAARGVPADFLVAAGSFWARDTAGARTSPPPNVRIQTEPVSFSELREQYRRSSIVVVPLHEVPNQAGVTSMLEGMSVGRSVVVTANQGQTDVVAGPLVRSGTDALDEQATRDRGPHAPVEGWTGLYVPPGDASALRRALMLLLDHPDRRAALEDAARRSVLRTFTFEAYVAGLARAVRDAGVRRPGIGLRQDSPQ
ncbi:MAG: glycosyltransferase family 4 protein [Dehalococcoidia bacterium]|nr:glycosyltransferase family 4 protein [Dehalococcoidia bacterium]